MKYNDLLAIFDLKILDDTDNISFVTVDGEHLQAFKVIRKDGMWVDNSSFSNKKDLSDHNMIHLIGSERDYMISFEYSPARNSFQLMNLQMDVNNKRYLLDLKSGKVVLNTYDINTHEELNGFTLAKKTDSVELFYKEFDKEDPMNDKVYHVDFFENGEYSNISSAESNIEFDYVCDSNDKVKSVLEVLDSELLEKALNSKITNEISGTIKK